MSNKVLAVVSVLGKDQKGVVAQFATYMAERGINIEDIEQRVVRGFFVMDMLVDLDDLSTDLSALITGLLELGQIDRHGSARSSAQRAQAEEAGDSGQQRAALPATADSTIFATAKLHGQIAGVLGNHPDLEPIAQDADLPFAWQLIRRSCGAFQVAAEIAC